MEIDWQTVDRWLVGEAWVGSRIDAHIAKLCREIGPRWSSSPEEKKAVEYVTEQMAANGLTDPRTEEFELDTWEHGPDEASIVEDGQPIDVKPLLNCPPVDTSSRLVDVGFGMKHEIDTAGVGLQGAIAIMNLGYEPFSVPKPLPERLRALAAAGAVAALIVEQKGGGRLGYRHATDKRWSDEAGTVLSHPLPAVFTTREHGVLLRSVADGGTILSLKIRSRSFTTTGYSTLADLPGQSSPDEWILLGAHHDTVPGSPGGNDDASGTAVVLECSRLMSLLARELGVRPGRSIRFATWGAEEQNHQGSAAYVRSHHGPEPLPRLVLNLDELAAGPIKGVVLQFPHLRPLMQQTLDSMGDGLRCHVLDHVDSSGDAFSFARRAIPTGMLWRWRFVGRHPDADFNHEPGDTADKVRPKELREYAWQLARLLLRLSNVPASDWPENPLRVDEVAARMKQEAGSVGRTM